MWRVFPFPCRQKNSSLVTELIDFFFQYLNSSKGLTAVPISYTLSRMCWMNVLFFRFVKPPAMLLPTFVPSFWRTTGSSTGIWFTVLFGRHPFSSRVPSDLYLNVTKGTTSDSFRFCRITERPISSIRLTSSSHTVF